MALTRLITTCAAFLLLAGTVLNSAATTYHVTKTGNDANVGTSASPYLTINKAAQVAQPGDSVIVHAGEYREWVQPARGGTSESARITYKAAPGEDVTIKGSERITTWQLQSGTVWKADIPDNFFGSYNPYTSTIAGRYTSEWLTGGAWCHLGEVYLDGQIFLEKQTLAEIQTVPKWWYTSHSGSTVSIYANFGANANPNTQVAEINVRESVFGKDVQSGINYITVDGFKMCQSAEEWLPTYVNSPNSKAVIFVSGTNWIVQNCVVWYGKMRGICIDSPNDIPTNHIVRGNLVRQTGISGIGGGHANNCIISGNWIQRIAGRPYRGVEHAFIKFHLTSNVTICGNVMCYINSPGEWTRGIWLDWPGGGNRITGNVMLYVSNGSWLQLENPSGANLIDDNIVYNAGAADIEDGNVLVHNLFVGCPINAAPGGWGNTQGFYNKAYNNISSGYTGFAQKEGNAADYNALLYGAKKSFDDVHSIIMSSPIVFTAGIDSIARTITIAFTVDSAAVALRCPVINTSFIGGLTVQQTQNLRILNPDGSSLTVDKDFSQYCRSPVPKVGPFQNLAAGRNTFVLRPNSNFGFRLPCSQPVAVVRSAAPKRFTMPADEPAMVYDVRGRLLQKTGPHGTAMAPKGFSKGVCIVAAVSGRLVQRAVLAK